MPEASRNFFWTPGGPGGRVIGGEGGGQQTSYNLFLHSSEKKPAFLAGISFYLRPIVLHILFRSMTRFVTCILVLEKWEFFGNSLWQKYQSAEYLFKSLQILV